jgi:hypothetical protein
LKPDKVLDIFLTPSFSGIEWGGSHAICTTRIPGSRHIIEVEM